MKLQFLELAVWQATVGEPFSDERELRGSLVIFGGNLKKPLPSITALLETDSAMTMTQASIHAPGIVELNWVPGDEFGLAELAKLARRRPAETIEVGTLGSAGYFSATTGDAAVAMLDGALERIRSGAAWAVFKDVQADATYAPSIDRLFRMVLDSFGVDADSAFNRRCHVFISSCGARTPLHADDNNGFLVQVSGQKEVVIYDMGKKYFSPRLARLRAKTARVFTMPAQYAYKGQRYTIHPGTGLTIPWNWPHEAETPAGSQSVSLNVSFETRKTRRYALAAVTNDFLLHVGRRPLAIGVNARSDVVKAFIGSLLNRIGLLVLIERHREIGDEIVC